MDRLDASGAHRGTLKARPTEAQKRAQAAQERGRIASAERDRQDRNELRAFNEAYPTMDIIFAKRDGELRSPKQDLANADAEIEKLEGELKRFYGDADHFYDAPHQMPVDKAERLKTITSNLDWARKYRDRVVADIQSIEKKYHAILTRREDLDRLKPSAGMANRDPADPLRDRPSPH